MAWTNETKASTTFTDETKGFSTFTNEAKSSGGTSIAIGTPIGLLLCLTYAAAIATSIWGNETKASSAWTNDTKASTTFTNESMS